jgi:CheY-like chemotaxis protein
MEVTGQLAGGIAHDFNNLLTVVLNNLELVAEKVATDQQPAIADALTAGQRAADLTGQLLGFARRKALRLAPVPLPQLITETVRIMAAMLDKRHQLEPMLVPTLPAVWADSGSVQQILLNLCLNARDVLATGGRIRLTAELVTLTALPSLLPGCADRPAEGWPLAPADTVEQILGELVGVPALGPFVRVSVMDNGCGMNAALLRRIFEPFFTTKPVGKGTGLGLAMTAGLVQQHNGWLICQSCPGVGTRFDVYLPLAPAVIEPPAVTPMPPPPPEPAPATTVLVVDDEAPLRTIAERFLTAQGYQVLQAEDGLQAIELYTAERARIGLVLLDHMMPKLSGRDTLERLYALDPRVRVVLSSGYADEVDWSAHGVVGVLHKPYRLHEMAEVVRSALTAGT